MRDNTWVRCRNCRSVFQNITVEEFRKLHHEASQDERFIEASVAACGLEPAAARWDKLSLPGKSVLEIGPGSGHLLAAAHEAGRTVTAVEHSEFHRRYIRDTWGIESIYSDIAVLPRELSFDVVVAINVFEHVYDINGFLRSIASRLTPGGTLFLSTANATSLEAALLRDRWCMCKPIDHVSFPSPNGMMQAAQAAGLQAERVWSAELPFELPISVLMAVRDSRRARRASMNAADGKGPGMSPARGGNIRLADEAEPTDPTLKAQLARFYSVSASFDPTSRVLGRLGRAGSLKARLRPTQVR